MSQTKDDVVQGTSVDELLKSIAGFGHCTQMPLPVIPEDPEAGTRAVVDADQVWQPGQTLGVYFLNSNPTYEQKVRTYTKLWSDCANIKFDFDSPNRPADITVNFDVNGVAGGFYGRFDSYVGKSSAAMRPSMNLIFDPNTVATYQNNGDTAGLESYYRRYVLHEFGHALGMMHEHQSPAINFQWNRETLYAFYQRTYNWGRQNVDEQVLKPLTGNLSNTEFDKASVMLYPIAPGLTTPEIVTDWNSELSPLDKFLMNLFYPLNEVTLTVGAPAVAGSIDTPGGAATYLFTTGADGKYVLETTGDAAIQMYVFGPRVRGTFIGEDHGSGVDLNAKFTVNGEENANYYAQVRMQNLAETGPFKISVKKA